MAGGLSSAYFSCSRIFAILSNCRADPGAENFSCSSRQSVKEAHGPKVDANQ